eukprot:TRINITY_DN36617_c0_g1_i1.p1 TRINITY_DN36617_c0_g1~~TRINITY_DN36617_c0_g1_i1.p1  ORF type:complete len:167 (-),score=18.83 TRINITY_DN36617_c0_g1_i1:310-810(-)
MPAWRAVLRDVGEKAVVFTNWACFYHCFTNYVMEVTLCLGPSMLPTFNESGDVVLLEHLSPRFENLQEGDVVIATSPMNPRVAVCKRLVAVEGSTVRVSEGHRLKRSITIPKGHVWLQGDNMANSTDSRHYGPVPYALIRGKVFYKIWPPGEFGPVVGKKAPRPSS